MAMHRRLLKLAFIVIILDANRWSYAKQELP
jgi:hypothetical protein